MTIDAGCVCGCSGEDHDYPGGKCLNCWHCDYFESSEPLTASDYEALDAIEPGSGDYWKNNQRRVW